MSSDAVMRKRMDFGLAAILKLVGSFDTAISGVLK
jgi:hypothetical protein